MIGRPGLLRRRWMLHAVNAAVTGLGGLGGLPRLGALGSVGSLGSLGGLGGLCGLGGLGALGVQPGTAHAQSLPDTVRRGRALAFPRDHGAHLDVRTEWWYATGWIGTPQTPTHGVQLTFFRSATGLAANTESRFAARQLLFAHAAITDLAGGRHLHDQRIARWSGESGAGLSRAAVHDGDVVLGPWSLRREGRVWQAQLPARDFSLDLTLTRSQPLLLQGDAGFSRKGPQEQQASHYYSEPQLLLRGKVQLDAAPKSTGLPTDEFSGRAWLDHEWSQEILHPQAVGWDWIGINLFDGSALTAFVLRRRDGSTLWAGGSWRAAVSAGATDGVAINFAPNDLQMKAGRRWRSPSSGGTYPMEWTLTCPAGPFTVRALMDAQELDSRQSTGTVYWEGLSELLDKAGQRVGLGYLEMTGYAAPLRLN